MRGGEAGSVTTDAFFLNITRHPVGNSLAAPIWRLKQSHLTHVFNQIKTKLAFSSEKWCMCVCVEIVFKQSSSLL